MAVEAINSRLKLTLKYDTADDCGNFSYASIKQDTDDDTVLALAKAISSLQKVQVKSICRTLARRLVRA